MNTVKPGIETTEHAMAQRAAATAQRASWLGVALVVLAGLAEMLTQFQALGVGGHNVAVVAAGLGALLKIAGTLGMTSASNGYATARGLAKQGADELGAGGVVVPIGGALVKRDGQVIVPPLPPEVDGPPPDPRAASSQG